jgi:hypothetical protein
MQSRLLPLLQLWAVFSVMLILPLWLMNGLLWPALRWDWLLIVCAGVGVLVTAVIALTLFKREP